MFQFSMDVKIQLFEIGAYRSDFWLWGWTKIEVYKEKVNKRTNYTLFKTQLMHSNLKYTLKTQSPL